MRLVLMGFIAMVGAGLMTWRAEARGAARAQTPPKADAEMQAVLDQLTALGGKPIETLSPEEARKQPTPADAVKALLKKQGKSTAPEAVGKVEDRSIGGAAGTIPARIYWPSGTGPFPALVYFHGGGWVIGSAEVYDATPRALVNLTGAAIVSVNYRLAPEHPFPAAHDDAAAAYEWVVKNAASINVDPRRIAVGGESAGGNLAVATAIAARDRKWPQPSTVVAVYPIGSGRTDSPSYRENAQAKPLNKAMMDWFFRHYTRSASELQDPRIDLVRADVTGLPPTVVVTAQIDPLRSDGEALTARLRKAGVRVAARDYAGVTHEFFGMSAVLAKAKDAQQFVAGHLKTGFASPR